MSDLGGQQAQSWGGVGSPHPEPWAPVVVGGGLSIQTQPPHGRKGVFSGVTGDFQSHPGRVQVVTQACELLLWTVGIHSTPNVELCSEDTDKA